MNTATASRFGATKRRPAQARRREALRAVPRRHGLAEVSIDVMTARSTSSTACDSPVSDVAGRAPRSTGPKSRSISATTFSHAGVTGKPSDGRALSVSTARLRILRWALANPSELSADRNTGTNRQDSPMIACPTGPVGELHEFPCLILALTARRDGQSGGADVGARAASAGSEGRPAKGRHRNPGPRRA